MLKKWLSILLFNYLILIACTNLYLDADAIAIVYLSEYV